MIVIYSQVRNQFVGQQLPGTNAEIFALDMIG